MSENNLFFNKGNSKTDLQYTEHPTVFTCCWLRVGLFVYGAAGVTVVALAVWYQSHYGLPSSCQASTVYHNRSPYIAKLKYLSNITVDICLTCIISLELELMLF